MLTAEGCTLRRRRLLDRLRPTQPVVFADPLNLRYLANFYVDPFSLGADYGGVLLLNPDGSTQLHYDHRVPKTSSEWAFADAKTAVPWYDGKSASRGPRRTILRPVVEQAGGRVHDSLGDPMVMQVFDVIGELRRAKDPDEIATVAACCRAGEAGMTWARANVRAGMTELDVYEGIFAACSTFVGRAVILYGDFAVTPGSAKRGGSPTGKVLANGETMILDFSVVIQGYRSDYTNTLVVGGQPTPQQQRLFDLCREAMIAGEQSLRAGATGKGVYQATRRPFEVAGVADSFPHHAGHGLGLAHPEAPFLVPLSDEVLVEGDIVTLEPGLYVDGVGGVRIEHNYLITATGFETISKHTLTLA